MLQVAKCQEFRFLLHEFANQLGFGFTFDWQVRKPEGFFEGHSSLPPFILLSLFLFLILTT